MTVGLATVAYANKVLDHMHRGVASTAPAGNYLATHIGDPGAAGTGNPSAVTTRSQATFAAAASGAVALLNTPSWASWAGGSQNISHLSNWDAATVGTFINSWALTVAKAVANGDTLSVTSLSVSLAPLAA